SDPRLLLPLEHSQHPNDQAPPRQASRRQRNDRDRSDRASLAAPDLPFVLAFNFVRNGPTVAIRARTINEALPDEAAGQGVEFRNSAGSGYGASRHTSVDANCEKDANCAADPCLAKVPGIIPRRDFTGDL